VLYFAGTSQQTLANMDPARLEPKLQKRPGNDYYRILKDSTERTRSTTANTSRTTTAIAIPFPKRNRETQHLFLPDTSYMYVIYYLY